MRTRHSAKILQGNPNAFAGVRSYFRQLGLTPDQLPQRTRPVVFIDLVAQGQTLGNLIGLLHQWCREANVAWDPAMKRIRIVGITEQAKTSPKTWR
jgi:hypothetical protein